MIRAAFLSVVILSAATLTSSVQAQQKTPPQPYPALTQQILLDRAGFSPGEIDGAIGSNTDRALAAYLRAHESPTGTPDDGILRGTAATGAADAFTSYTITREDAAGPFVAIPADMMAKAKLARLNYSSLLEELGERFHCTPALLHGLNPRARFVAGARIKVPNVSAPVAPAPGSAANVVVSKNASSLTVFDAAGKTIFYAPTTSGSEHDPLPLGTWAVTAILQNPTFNYNPDLFWDADPTHTKTRIAAGPNGPVGVVWISISKENYGLHGTPEPVLVGHSESHGCVRLTNWDATKLANLVKKGTPVVFEE